MDFGLSSVVSACTLCYQIYDRCSASRGEFKRLSNEALGLHSILETIQGAWQRGSLTSRQITSLRTHIIPLIDLLERINARLQKHGSLGTASPKLSDKINWALAGGAAEIHSELGSQLQILNVWISSVVLQREHQADQVPQLSTPPLDIESQVEVFGPSLPPTAHLLETPLQSTSAAERHSLGIHSIGDGIQFVIFSILSLLGFAIILTIGCFYIISFILFSFGQIPTLCVHTWRDLKALNKFYRKLFTKIFRFISGLWD